MKKVFFLSILAAAVIVLASFTKHTSTQTPGAQPFNVQFNYDLTGGMTVSPCTGELIDLSGSVHYDDHGVYNPKDNSLKETFHGNYQGVTGVGETSGAVYHLTGASNTTESWSSDGCTVTVNEIETVNYTTAGPGNNFYEKTRVTQTINLCTGDYSIKRDVFESGCR